MFRCCLSSRPYVVACSLCLFSAHVCRRCSIEPPSRTQHMLVAEAKRSEEIRTARKPLSTGPTSRRVRYMHICSPAARYSVGRTCMFALNSHTPCPHRGRTDFAVP